MEDALSARPVRFAYLERPALLLFPRLPLFFFLPREGLAGHGERKECDDAIGPHSFLAGEAERSGAKVDRLNENPVCFMQCDNKSQ